MTNIVRRGPPFSEETFRSFWTVSTDQAFTATITTHIFLNTHVCVVLTFPFGILPMTSFPLAITAPMTTE